MTSSIFTHFNGDLINKYCKQDYKVSSYLTPSNDSKSEHFFLSKSIVWIIDFGILYDSCFTQKESRILDNFQNVLDGYYKYFNEILPVADSALVVGINSGSLRVGYFDHYIENGYLDKIEKFSRKVRELLYKSHNGLYIYYNSIEEQNEKNYKISNSIGCTFDPNLFKFLGETIDSFFNSKSLKFKAIIFDLDNTLWKGVIGEGFINTSLGDPSLDDSGYLLLRNFIRLAYESGIYTAVCSKNNSSTLKNELEASGNGHLLNFFTVIKADWNDKSISIKNIANDLNIGLESCIFIDDNPRELKNIANKVPEVFLIDASSGPWSTLKFLHSGDFFDRQFILKDDINRNISMSARINGFFPKKQSLEAHDFDHDADFYVCDHSNKVVQKRVEQLSIKTNQFNLSTRRYAWRDIQDLIENNNFKLLVYGCKDMYGDLGIIGYILFQENKKSLLIHDWIMSCRAFGLKLELKILNKISKEHNRKIIEVNYIPNGKNQIAISFLDKVINQKIVFS